MCSLGTGWDAWADRCVTLGRFGLSNPEPEGARGADRRLCGCRAGGVPAAVKSRSPVESRPRTRTAEDDESSALSVLVSGCPTLPSEGSVVPSNRLISEGAGSQVVIIGPHRSAIRPASGRPGRSCAEVVRRCRRAPPTSGRDEAEHPSIWVLTNEDAGGPLQSQTVLAGSPEPGAAHLFVARQRRHGVVRPRTDGLNQALG
jgi:hypothetical protein